MANKKLMISAIFLTLFMAEGCNNQEDGKEHLQKGIEYLNKGEYDKAKLELETSSQSDKDTAQTYYYLALLDEKNHQYRTMKENLIKSLELGPNNIEARVKLGNVLLLLGEPVKAMEQAEFILKENGQDLKGLTLKASSYISQKKLADGEKVLDQILQGEPNQIDALSLKSLIYAEKNDLKKAIEYINAAIRLDEKNVAFQLFKIQLHAKENDFNSVVSDYKRLIGVYPDNPDYKVMLAKVYTQLGNKKEAEDLLREVVTKYPADVKPKLLLLDFIEIIVCLLLVIGFKGGWNGF
jgi:tetratricopeptide (TPR) repeat protein